MTVIGADKLDRQLRFLASAAPKTVERALRGLAFDVKADIEAHVAKAFEFSGPGTQKFISRYRIKYATRNGVFTAVLAPRGKKSMDILSRHVERTTVTARDRADLLVDDALIAIPLQSGPVKRSRTGKISRRFLPRELLKRDAKGKTKGFVNTSRTALLYRAKGGEVQPLYALKSATTNPDRLDVPQVAARSIRRRLGGAISRAVRKAMAESKNV
jgi:hypothetical protein